MEILKLVFFVLFVPLFAISVASIIVTFPDWKFYKKVYETLPERKFYKNNDQVYCHNLEDLLEGKPSSNFVWFTDDNTFQINEKVYLGFTAMNFSPYTLYWHRKFIKWCIENIDLKTIDKF